MAIRRDRFVNDEKLYVEREDRMSKKNVKILYFICSK